MAQHKKGDIYIERRQEGDYAVKRKGANRASAVEPTQAKAIAKAQEMFPDVKPNVSRVKYTKKGKPDKWRKK